MAGEKIPLSEQIGCIVAAREAAAARRDSGAYRGFAAVLDTLKWLQANEPEIRAFVELKKGFPDAEMRVRTREAAGG